MRTFLMEEVLEKERFNAAYNAGESGGSHLSLREIVELIASSQSQANSQNKEALLSELLDLSLRDSPNYGGTELRRHIARLHPQAKPENVLVTTGTSEALFLAFQVLKPKKVAVIVPGFQLLTELIEAEPPVTASAAPGGRIVQLPMRWNQQLQPEVNESEWLEILYSEKPDTILFNHPHNPSGWVPSVAFLRHIRDAASAIGARILADEHYRFLCLNEASAPNASLQAEYPLGPTLFAQDGSTLVTGSYIKCLGTPGLRIGWCVGPKQIIDQIQSLKNYTTHTVNPVSEWVSEHVLRDPQLPCFRASHSLWLKNRELLRNWALTQVSSQSQRGWLCEPPKGGWVTTLSHQSFPTKKNELSEKLTKQGCFMLDLDLMELQRFTQNDCFLRRRGGFRLGLGLPYEKLRMLLEILDFEDRKLFP